MKCPGPQLPALLLICTTQVPGEALFFSQDLCFFQRFRKPLRNSTCTAQRPFPVRRFGCPLTPGVPPLYLAMIVACMPHSFSASSPTSDCRDQCRAFGALFFIFKPEQELWPVCTHRAPRRSQLIVRGAAKAVP